jgi:hypothetical protein
MWICQDCGADVQADWDTCWNCTQTRDDVPAAAFVAEPSPVEQTCGHRRSHVPSTSVQVDRG